MEPSPRSLSSPCHSFSQVLSADRSPRCPLAFVFGGTAEHKVNAPWTGPNAHPIPSLSVCQLRRHRTDERCALPLPRRPGKMEKDESVSCLQNRVALITQHPEPPDRCHLFFKVLPCLRSCIHLWILLK